MAGDEGTELLAELREEMSQLRERIEELSKAKTPQQVKDAEDAVDDAEADVEAIAKRMGVPVASLRASILEARKAAFREEHSDSIRELIREEFETLRKAAENTLDADNADDTDDTDGADDKAKAKAKAKAKPAKEDDADDKPDDKPDDDKPDDPPAAEHWTGRSLSSLFGS